MKLTDIFKAINFYQRYREICLIFSKVDYTKPRPPKDEVLERLNKIGYKAKYISKDRVYISKFEAGIYTFEYYFEFDGTGCYISIYIKKSASDWPFQSSLSGILMTSNIYPKKAQDEVIGYFLLTPSLEELENALIKMKSILDDIKNTVIPELVNDNIEFDI
jgi:hypothetical protein